MPFIKDVLLKPVKGGFLIKYDYMDKENDEDHASIRFINTIEEVKETAKEAMDRVMILANAKNNLDFYTATGELKEAVIKKATQDPGSSHKE